ncbi:DUF2142 domain-containing protein [Patescibacteria group bacterium]|nr:MAG: DUF2142 domain-containing protein [Patescibacteria group bacterium]
MDKKIFLIFAIFTVIKGLLWIWSIPPFLAPDELPHFAYTQYLVEEKAIPKNTGKIMPLVTSMSEELEMASKLMQDRHLSISFSHMIFPEKYEPIPNEFSNYSRTVNKENYKNSAAIYSPFYYAIEAIPYILGYNLDFFSRFYLMRIFSLIFLFVTLIYSYKAALLVSGEKIFAITAAIIVSLMPSINSSSFGGINNDAALIALSQILIYWTLKTINNPNAKIVTTIGGGVLLGMTLLTKPQAIIFIPFVAGILLYKGFKEKMIRRALIALFVILLIALTIAAPFYIDPITYLLNDLGGGSNQALNIFSLDNISAAIGSDITGRLSMLFEFWLQTQLFANLYPFYVLSLILALELAAIIGLAYIAKDYLKKITAPSKNFYVYLMICIAAFFMLDIFLKLLYYKGALTNQYYGFGGQGRYYFPIIGPIIILFLAGLRRFSFRLKIPVNAIYASLILFFLILHNYALFNIILQSNYI